MLKLMGIFLWIRRFINKFFRFIHEYMCMVELNKFGDIIIKCI